MHAPDFLHKDAETNLCEHYIAGGALCKLLTNSEQMLEAASETFLSVRKPARPVDFSVRFWVDDPRQSRHPWPKPYVRGLDHLIFAAFDEDSSMLANLRKRHVIGRFSERMAADRAYYKHVVFPMLLSIVGATVGVAELHSACVVKDEVGVLLAGPSGAGKSTLALALAQHGFGFVSDDRTFCSLQNDQVQVWGLPTLLKLRSEAVGWFPELQNSVTTSVHEGDVDSWFEPEHLAGVIRRRHGRATSLIFLERRGTAKLAWAPVPPAEALTHLNQEMMTELPETITRRSEIVKKIAKLPSWRLQYGGEPQEVARQICAHIAGT